MALIGAGDMRHLRERGSDAVRLVRVEIDESVWIYFDVAGEGLAPGTSGLVERPTVLMLHGGPGADHSTLKPAFSELSDVAQVVYFDHRGQGRSDRRPSSEWTLDTWADDVVRFCEALDITSPIVIGNSFGGMVAQHYASRHPAHPSGVVPISTTARFDVEATVAAFRRLGGDEAALAAHNVFVNPSEVSRDEYFKVCGPLYTKKAGNPFNSVLWHHELAEHFIHREQRTMDLRPGLSKVMVPCQILSGVDDPIFPPVTSEIIAASLTGTTSDLRVFDDCAHAVHRDQPVKTFTAIREFIETVATTS